MTNRIYALVGDLLFRIYYAATRVSHDIRGDDKMVSSHWL